MGGTFILVLVVVGGLAFDFTNGFHDTANAMATSIATGALKPRVAVMISAVLNFAGAFISIEVAATIAKGIIDPKVLVGGEGLVLVLAALIGAMTWNLITWYLSIPSSSSHALIGGIIGATVVDAGWSAVNGRGLVSSVIIPALFSPLIAGAVAGLGTYGAYKLMRWVGEKWENAGYKYGQIGSASLVSLAHGTNDAQKTMGVISLALIANGSISAANFSVPLWVKFACATAIAAGTATGGWRIINTMGNKITDIAPPQGFAAESSTASVILAASYFGYPLSTTQVVTGSVMGSGLGRKLDSVHWNVLGKMVGAWIFTIPCAAILGGIAWAIADIFGAKSNLGALVIFALAALGAFVLWRLAQRSKVTPDDLDRTETAPPSSPPPPAPTPAPATA
jgi:inorganic phosphate transporter, PiT family